MQQSAILSPLRWEDQCTTKQKCLLNLTAIQLSYLRGTVVVFLIKTMETQKMSNTVSISSHLHRKRFEVFLFLSVATAGHCTLDKLHLSSHSFCGRIPSMLFVSCGVFFYYYFLQQPDDIMVKVHSTNPSLLCSNPSVVKWIEFILSLHFYWLFVLKHRVDRLPG